MNFFIASLSINLVSLRVDKLCLETLFYIQEVVTINKNLFFLFRSADDAVRPNKGWIVPARPALADSDMPDSLEQQQQQQQQKGTEQQPPPIPSCPPPEFEDVENSI